MANAGASPGRRAGASVSARVNDKTLAGRVRTADAMPPTRRDLLAGAGAGLAALAGCSGRPSRSTATPTPRTYDRLRRTATYVEEDVDVTLPDGSPTVTAPTNADLVVLPDDAERDPDTVVTWLADDRAVALVGEDSQETWLGWATSEPFRSAFTGGSARGEPAPDLLVAAARGTTVATHRSTWSDGPTDAELVGGLEDGLQSVTTPAPTAEG